MTKTIKLSSSIVGDIAPYTNNDLVKFVRSDLIGDITAKPQFASNVFVKPRIAGNSVDSLTASFYQISNYTNSDLEPWYDNYTQYFSNIRSYSQDHSIIPEFIVSNFDNITISETVRSVQGTGLTYYSGVDYLKYNGREKSIQKSEDLYENIKLDSFINKKSNKIKFVFNGVKKLLPYNGFYPSQYSQVLAKKFADSYFTASLSSVEKMAMIQPIFGPGVFFNTIKAGIAMSYPAVTRNTVEDGTIYGTNNLGETVLTVTNLKDKFTFENLLLPQTFFNNISNQYLIYADPTRYDSLLHNNPANKFYPTYDKEKFIVNNSGYTLAMNNFLAESVNFFLQNSQLTSFESQPESEFKIPEADKSYGMKIKITKNNNFSMFSKFYEVGEGIFPIPEESLFGPPLNIFNFKTTLDYEPYLAYAPKYLKTYPTEGNSNILTVYCKNLSATKPTVQDLIKNLYIATTEQGQTLDGKSYIDFVKYYGGKADVAALYTLIDSLSLRQQISEKDITIDPITGEQTAATDVKNNYRWSIQTKFECPLIDYSDFQLNYEYGGEETIEVENDSYTENAKLLTSYQSIDGIWNKKGTIPQDGESVQIEVYDDEFGEYSLLNLCGFKPEKKSIGQIANTKEIKEGVLVIPYLKNKFATNTTQAITDERDKHFIKISREAVSKVLGVPDYAKISINKIKKILETSSKVDKNSEITKLLTFMSTYNIPPHLNWLKDKSLEPFVMYSAEFSHQLGKQDLADIWQGTMPKIATTPEEQQVVSEYSLDGTGMISRSELDQYLKVGMYIKIFKVKYRGKMAYAEITAGAEDDARFAQQFGDKWYSYNWPYDYFSLVELLNIKAGEVYENTGSV